MKIGKSTGTRPPHRRLRLSFVREESGSQMVELGLVLMPLMCVVFLILDAGWLFFAQESLQYAVQMGVRAAITSYVPTANGKTQGQDAYLKSIVQSNAMGFLAGQTGLDTITINYYNPASTSTKPLNGAGSNAGGNLIEISVKSVPVAILGNVFGNASPTLSLGAVSSDVMESTPTTGAPQR